MRRLITPVQYEPAIGGLNEVRPLILSDEVKIALDIPILNTKPVSQERSAIGKMSRCTEQGGLLRSKLIGYENYQKITREFEEEEESQIVYFAQKVSGFYVWITSHTSISYFRWVTYVTSVEIQDLYLAQGTWCNFSGRLLKLNAWGTGEWSLSADIYGLY